MKSFHQESQDMLRLDRWNARQLDRNSGDSPFSLMHHGDKFGAVNTVFIEQNISPVNKERLEKKESNFLDVNQTSPL